MERDSEEEELREELLKQRLEMMAEEDILRREEELLALWEQEAEKEAMLEVLFYLNECMLNYQEVEIMKARIERLREEEEKLNSLLRSAKM